MSTTDSRWRNGLAVIADMASIATAIMMAVLMVLAVSTALVRLGQRGAPSGVDGRLPAGSMNRPARPPLIAAVEGLETSMGDASIVPDGARVALIEFSDFECPFCKKFARDVYPRLKQEFVDTAKVAYIARNFPLEAIHPLALKASEAAECAREQGKFWQMRDELYAQDRPLSESDFLVHARTLGLDKSAFAGCLSAGRVSVAKADHAEGVRLGVKSTPTFLISIIQSDGRIIPRRRLMGALPYQVFKSAIEQVLAESKSAP